MVLHICWNVKVQSVLRCANVGCVKSRLVTFHKLGLSSGNHMYTYYLEEFGILPPSRPATRSLNCWATWSIWRRCCTYDKVCWNVLRCAKICWNVQACFYVQTSGVIGSIGQAWTILHVTSIITYNSWPCDILYKYSKFLNNIILICLYMEYTLSSIYIHTI